ncbi:MAG TPA: hypothetical protein K8U77_04755 [Slackia equolifaciens]|uniref:Thrombospondin n=1 Tax=Slackia equolifaciens TaxID=498718 RepID=A0A9D2UWN5_9ACTN|nr:hypothetical protein [Slackia equolifaciens]
MKAKASMVSSEGKKAFGKRAWIAVATAALMVAAMGALAGCSANAAEGGEPAVQADASQAVAATQSALEQATVGSTARGAQATCSGYVDENGDGICDNCGTNSGSCAGFVDADGDGVCDNYGNGCYGHGSHGWCQGGACGGYVDADGDGVCDNCGANAGSCPGFVDADGDGVCDNYGNGAGAGYVDSNNDGVCDNYGTGAGNGYGCGNGGGHHGAGHGCGRW